MSKCGKSLRTRRSLSVQTELRPPSQIDKPDFFLKFSFGRSFHPESPTVKRKQLWSPLILIPHPLHPHVTENSAGVRLRAMNKAAWMKKFQNSTFTIRDGLGDERRRRQTVILRSTEKLNLRWARSYPSLLRALQNLLYAHTRAFYINIGFSTNLPLFFLSVEEHLRLFPPQLVHSDCF